MTTTRGLPDGSEAPDFELRDQHGTPVRLSSFRGARDAVLVFYPYAFSRVCTGELTALRDAWPQLDRDDVAVLGLSCDPMFSLRGYSDAEGIGFPLLSDFWPHGAVAQAYGVFDETSGTPGRSSYVVDPEGRIAWAVHNARPDPRPVADLQRALEALTGLVEQPSGPQGEIPPLGVDACWPMCFTTAAAAGDPRRQRLLHFCPESPAKRHLRRAETSLASR